MLQFAAKLTREPHRITAKDYEPLRALGFDDEALYDLIFMISFSNHMDRVADALNAVVGDEEDRCRAMADAAARKAGG